MKAEWTGTEYRMTFSAEEKARLAAYYGDPEVCWFDAGTIACGGPLIGTGYYVLAHCCRIECCRPEGPFATTEEAREWSRKNWLPEVENAPQTP